MPKVSVIIPVYNVETYLRQALDSVVNQTLSDIEIICVDDCSTDNSLNILKEYALKDSRFVVIEQDKNQGAGVARNRALDIANGEYIMFLDPDDWYELDACEVAYNQIKKNNNDLCMYDYIIHCEESGKVSTGSMIKKFDDVLNEKCINISEIKFPFLDSFYTVMHIFNRKYLNDNNIRYKNCHFGEDAIFYIRALFLSSSFSIIQKPIYNYRRINKKNRDIHLLCQEHIMTRAEINDWFLNNNKEHIYIYWCYYIPNLIYSLHKFVLLDSTVEKDLYNSIREIFRQLDINYINQHVKNYIAKKAYREFILIRNSKYQTYKLICILKKIIAQIFALKNSDGYKVLVILGIKFKLKKMKSKQN